MVHIPFVDAAKRAWASWPVAPSVLLAAVGACVWFWFHPSSGEAIAVLGAVAAMRAFEKWGPKEEFCWTVVVFALLFVELHSIRENDREVARERDQEAQRFKSIADGLSKTIRNSQVSIANSQIAFDVTLERMERLDKLSRESIDQVTGGDGFVYIDIVKPPVDKDGLSLRTVVHGKYVIRGVRYEITEGRPPYIPTNQQINDLLTGRFHGSAQVGELHPAVTMILGRVYHPSLKDGGYYNINIDAMNGNVNEKLEVRYEPTLQNWNRSITVTRNSTVIFSSNWW